MKNGSALLITIVLGMATPALAAPPPHAPAHGYHAKHRYIYYREREIYYAPESRLWFWLDGGDWRFGARLPSIYQQFTSNGVAIELGSDRPYSEHRHVVERYGKGSRHGARHKRRSRD